MKKVVLAIVMSIGIYANAATLICLKDNEKKVGKVDGTILFEKQIPATGIVSHEYNGNWGVFGNETKFVLNFNLKKNGSCLYHIWDISMKQDGSVVMGREAEDGLTLSFCYAPAIVNQALAIKCYVK